MMSIWIWPDPRPNLRPGQNKCVSIPSLQIISKMGPGNIRNTTNNKYLRAKGPKGHKGVQKKIFKGHRSQRVLKGPKGVQKTIFYVNVIMAYGVHRLNWLINNYIPSLHIPCWFSVGKMRPTNSLQFWRCDELEYCKWRQLW